MRRIIALCICCISLSALAAEPDPIKKAEELLTGMEYPAALRQAERILKSPYSGPRELVAGYRIQGISLSALGRNAEATMVFLELLAIEPTFQLANDVSPKLRPPFLQAVEASAGQSAIRLSHNPPLDPPRLSGLQLQAQLEADPLKMVRAVRLRYRVGGNRTFELQLPVTGPGEVTFRLPVGLAADGLQYWLEATNEFGGALARAGAPDAPLALRASATASATPGQGDPAVETDETLESTQSGTWYTAWWFWTAVGVATGAIVIGVAVATTQGGESDPLRWNIQIH